MSRAALLRENILPAHAAVTTHPESVLARFLELRGRRVVHACGASWYTVPGRFLMSLPYQRMLDPQPEELRRLIRDARTCGARFPSLRWNGLSSGLYVVRPGPYDIASLHVKHRPRVRHALKCFEFRMAEKSDLLEQGRALNLGTMARQERYDPEFADCRRWETFVEAAFACRGIAVPAIFRGSRLAAYMITCREQHWLHILHQMSSMDCLSDFPNHMLTYSVTAQAAADQSLEAICYGYVPLFAADGLHEYKLRFGYELIPHRSAIQLHPLLGAAVDHPAFRTALRLARRLRPSDQRLETVQTVLQGAGLSAHH
jgi:hypothetical protein